MKKILLDISPAYLFFAVQCAKSDGAKIDPTVDGLAVYEIDGTSATIGGTGIAGSPFDPVQFELKTGLWAVKIAKSAFTEGRQYLFLWEMTVDGKTAAKQEIYHACNAADFQADIAGLSTFDPATAEVMTDAASRTASQADVSGLATLLARLTEARAGYLEKLDVTGEIANTANAANFKADVIGLATSAEIAALNDFDPSVDRVDVAKIAGTAITGPSDLKADISGLATNTGVWTHPTRGLTEAVTTDAESRSASQADTSSLSTQDSVDIIDAIVGAIRAVTDKLSAMLENTGTYDRWLSTALEEAPTGAGEGTTPADIWGYTGVRALNSPVETDSASREASKANITGLATSAEIAALKNFDSATDTVNIRAINDVPVTGPGDFKADVTGLAIEASVQAIKTKTDALPVDPASEAVAATNKDAIIENQATLGTTINNIYETTQVLAAGDGSGKINIQYYETGTTSPIADVNVAIYAFDEMKASTQVGLSGFQAFAVDEGGPYEVRSRKGGYSFEIETIEDVSGTLDLTIYGSPLFLPLPETAGDCRLSLFVGGASEGDILTTSQDAYAQIVDLPSITGGRFRIGERVVANFDESRQEIYWEIVQAASVLIVAPIFGIRHKITVPQIENASLENLI